MIRRFPIAAMLVAGLGLALSACSKAEPRSPQYFAAHLDEARQIDAQCRDGSTRGQECTNADLAVQEADRRARLKKFLGN